MQQACNMHAILFRVFIDHKLLCSQDISDVLKLLCSIKILLCVYMYLIKFWSSSCWQVSSQCVGGTYQCNHCLGSTNQYCSYFPCIVALWYQVILGGGLARWSTPRHHCVKQSLPRETLILDARKWQTRSKPKRKLERGKHTFHKPQISETQSVVTLARVYYSCLTGFASSWFIARPVHLLCDAVINSSQLPRNHVIVTQYPVSFTRKFASDTKPLFRFCGWGLGTRLANL